MNTGCSKWQTLIDLHKVDYDKVWNAFLLTASAMGSLLYSKTFNWLTILTAALLVAEVITLIALHKRIVRLSKLLENCES